MTELDTRTTLAPPPPPHGQRVLAHTIALLTLPSGLWRVAFVVGLPVTAAGGLAMLTTMERIQLVGLSLFVEMLALLALGLVQRWGEVVPGWVPVLRGRAVPRLVATVPAMLGALALTYMWTLAAVRFADQVGDGSLDWMWPETWQKTLLVVCYLPLVAWGPLLAVLTVCYHRRRGRQPAPISR